MKGPIPANILTLKVIEEIELFNNRLTGVLPTNGWDGPGLANLKVLTLSEYI